MTKLQSFTQRHLLLPTASLVLAGGALLGGAAVLHAQDPVASPTPEGHHWRHHGGGPGGPLGHFLGKARAELGLTDAQLQQMHDILRASKPAVQPLVQQLVAEKRALRPLVQAATVDEPAIRAQAAKVAAVEADLAVQHAKIASQIRGVLTPEQATKVQDFQSKMDGKFDGFLGHLFHRLDH